MRVSLCHLLGAVSMQFSFRAAALTSLYRPYCVLAATKSSSRLTNSSTSCAAPLARRLSSSQLDFFPDVDEVDLPEIVDSEASAISKKRSVESAKESPQPNVQRDSLLVVGLGNPGSEYELTRHNIGFLVVEELARRWNISLRSQKKFLGKYSSCNAFGKSVGFLMPSTYMNNSGQSAVQVAGYFKLKPENVLVVTDDVSLNFGVFRFREEGSAGGHNGLKSMEAHLKTRKYNRLRIGVGSPKNDLVSHVLGEFSREEKNDLDLVVSLGATSVEHWIQFDDPLKIKSLVNGKKL